MLTKRPKRKVALVIVALTAALALAAGGLLVVRPWGGAQSSPTAGQAGWSVARRWDEALLDAIRRALPNPPVHARNLFHTSVAMWDAWAAYDPQAAVTSGRTSRCPSSTISWTRCTIRST